jgi:hypothetical protein
MDMELQLSVFILEDLGELRTHPKSMTKSGGWKDWTYNGYFPTELILDLAFFVGIWTLLLDDLKELLDTHLGGGIIAMWC